MLYTNNHPINKIDKNTYICYFNHFADVLQVFFVWRYFSGFTLKSASYYKKGYNKGGQFHTS